MINYEFWLRNLSSNNFLQEETNLIWVVENSGNKQAKESAKLKLVILNKVKEEKNG